MYFEAVSNRRINYLLGSENMYKSNGPGELLVEHPGEQCHLNRRGSCVYGILITVESEPELLCLFFFFCSTEILSFIQVCKGKEA